MLHSNVNYSKDKITNLRKKNLIILILITISLLMMKFKEKEIFLNTRRILKINLLIAEIIKKII